ncbi:MAG: DUF3365 domain-containing protein [Deferribacterales bacterium]
MRQIFYAPIFFFILFIAFLISFELYQGRQNYNRILESKARELVNATITFRKWAARVENLYADTDKVAPNPYLAWRDDRDINTDGYHLTMVNPSYMTRLVSEIFAESDGVQIRMVGVNPLNHANAPEEWEEEGLEAFRNGAKSFSIHSSAPFFNSTYRYISPLYVDESCLSCHARDGYEENELIGGISVTIPESKISYVMLRGTVRNVTVYAMISLVLIITVTLLQKKVFMLTQEQEKAIDDLNAEIKHREMTENALMRQTRIASQGELLTLVSHHWRQPLNAISLTFDMIKDELAQMKMSDKDTYENIGHSQELIQELSGSIDMFKQSFASTENSEFSLTQALITATNAFEPILYSSSIKLWLKCSSGYALEDICICSSKKRALMKCPFKDLKIKGNESEFNQIILALLKNAYEAIMEYRASGGDVRSGYIAIDMQIEEEQIRISVTDNGIGISDENADKVFDPYYTSKGYEYGRGMGLYFAKVLAKHFGGGDISLIRGEEHTEFIVTIGG